MTKVLRSSVTSSSSSGFEEALESPTPLSALPLLGTQANTGADQGFSESLSMMVRYPYSRHYSVYEYNLVCASSVLDDKP